MITDWKIGATACADGRTGIWGGYIERIHPKTKRATIRCYWYLDRKEQDFFEVEKRKVFKLKNLRRPNYVKSN